MSGLATKLCVLKYISLTVKVLIIEIYMEGMFDAE